MVTRTVGSIPKHGAANIPQFGKIESIIRHRAVLTANAKSCNHNFCGNGEAFSRDKRVIALDRRGDGGSGAGYANLKPCYKAFIETRSLRSKPTEHFAVIGPSVAGNPEQHVRNTEPHGGSLEHC